MSAASEPGAFSSFAECVSNIGNRRRSRTASTITPKASRREALPQPITSASEIRGWCLYDSANGAFFYGVLNFLPLLLLGQAEECAHVAACQRLHPSVPADLQRATWDCNMTNPVDVMVPWCSCMTSDATWFDGSEEIAERALVVFLGQFEVHYATVYATATSISVVFQLLIFVCCSSMADFGSMRYKLFMASNLLGSFACILIGLFGGGYDLTSMDLNVLCFIVANVSFGFAVVMYNAYLPLLVVSHPEVESSTADEFPKVRERVESQLSSTGIKFGMGGQIGFLFVAAGFLATGLSLAHLVLAGGLWTLSIGTYAICQLQQRPGPPLPARAGYVGTSLRQIVGTCGKVKMLPQLFLFLGAYFVFSDGCSTVASQASTLATTLLDASSLVIIGVVIEMSFAAIAGCAFTFYLQAQRNVSPKVILVSALCVQAVLPLWALVMSTQAELWIVGLLFGFATGPQQAFTRSIFASMLPKGHEAEFFGFYEVTDKGTAWAGPMLLTAIGTATGNFRIGYASLISFYVVGVALLTCFNPIEGGAEKQRFEENDPQNLQLRSMTEASPF